MTQYDIPLPKRADKKDWRKDEIDKVVRNQYDSETDDHESIDYQRRINTESTLHVLCLSADKQRDKNHTE